MLTLPGLETLTRIGFAARGVIYALIGYLALRFGQAEDQSGALSKMAEGAGKVLLVLMAIGLVGYGLWRLSEAVVDSEGHGTKAIGMAARAGGLVSGLAHLGFAFLAFRLALGGGGAGGGSEGTEQGAATALSLPGGGLLVVLAGLALIGTGFWQLAKAVRADFLKHLDRRAAHQTWVMALGRAGYSARGIVFLVTGWFLVRAGLSDEAGEAGGMERALASLSGGLLTAVALGLLLFGLFSFVEARYRRINDPKVIDRLRSAAARTG